MTEKQKEQYNRMLFTLRKICNDYQTPDQLRRYCGKDYGLDFETAIEYAYENIQQDAKNATRYVKPIK